MKIRLALKIWNSSNYNSFMISKSRTTVLKWVNNYKTPNSVLRKMKLSKLKDKILSKNNIISNKLSQYINNKSYGKRTKSMDQR